MAKKGTASESTKETRPAKPPRKKANADAGTKKLSAINAAAKVLAEAAEPMNCHEIIEAMAKKGYWTSPGGKTPHATLYSAIQRELKIKGNDTRFKKAGPGKFTRKDG
jgi:hypothetical protein